MQDGRKKAVVINVAMNKGKKLAYKHPELVDDYRKGMTRKELVERYLPLKQRGKIAETIITYALRELLTPKERKELRRQHQSNGGKKVYKSKKGAHDIVGRKNTYIGDFRNVGFVTKYGQVYETKMDERSFVINLRLSGYSWKEITDFVNEKFGHNRSMESIRTSYHAWKGKLFDELKLDRTKK